MAIPISNGDGDHDDTESFMDLRWLLGPRPYFSVIVSPGAWGECPKRPSTTSGFEEWSFAAGSGCDLVEAWRDRAGTPATCDFGDSTLRVSRVLESERTIAVSASAGETTSASAWTDGTRMAVLWGD